MVGTRLTAWLGAITLDFSAIESVNNEVIQASKSNQTCDGKQSKLVGRKNLAHERPVSPKYEVSGDPSSRNRGFEGRGLWDGWYCEYITCV